MKLNDIIAIVESGINLGLTAADIVQRMCSDHGGESLPTLEEFEAHVDRLRNTPDLTPKV